jgi:small subunit ribosomal protein S8
MSMSDPLADMFTRILNGQAAGKKQVGMPSSKLKVAICNVLLSEGYIESYTVSEVEEKSHLDITLKYYKGVAVIDSLKRVSRPGKRVYKSSREIPNVLGGLGIAIVSTSKGLMTDKVAKEQGYGGEVMCLVS